ncbi:MAG: peptide chain release factor-like protein [Candidatus Omnitrophica bacterium]|nr:peptide chain release factor-like protein [Candidatus Omnitrophota bacterium]MCM8807349.1 peptide chain release factor-like protein [Candidatus Omnitrophota bacterium]
MGNIKKDIKFYYFKSSGPGGQRKNKKLTSVRIVHIPTGITAIGTEFRSQAKNKEIALKRLKEKLKKLNEKKKIRIKTEKPEWVKEKQIEEKRKRSEKKKLRKKIKIEDVSY